MLGVIKVLTDVGNYIKELKTYFGLKNQTLFIQHYSKHYFNKWILDGIQEQLRHKVQFTGSLDCNRQSIVQRGCCHA